jgi:hypothetical protein
MPDSLGVTTYVYDDVYRVISITAPFTGTVGYVHTQMYGFVKRQTAREP